MDLDVERDHLGYEQPLPTDEMPPRLLPISGWQRKNSVSAPTHPSLSSSPAHVNGRARPQSLVAKKEPTGFNELPQEVILHIFTFLHPKEIPTRIALICKQWR